MLGSRIVRLLLGCLLLADATASSPLEVSGKFDPKEQTLNVQLKNVSSSLVRIDGLSLRQPIIRLSTTRPDSWNPIQDLYILSDKHIKRTMNDVDLSLANTSIQELKPSEVFEIDYDLSEIIRDYSKKLPEGSKKNTTSFYFKLRNLFGNIRPIEGLDEIKIVEPVRINFEFVIDELNATTP